VQDTAALHALFTLELNRVAHILNISRLPFIPPAIPEEEA
jgi:hypothetical protein